jgi:hypothetical protein
MAMKEVAQATAPLRKMSQKNLEDYETDSLPYAETGMIKTYRSLQVYQRSYSQVGHRVLSDLKRVSLLKSFDKILPGRRESWRDL